jgi:hypothetical protein
MQRKPLPLPSRDNAQVSEYADAVKRGLRNYYISSTKDGWSVRKADANKADGNFSSKATAITHAKRAASSMADIIIHNKDGSITMIELKRAPKPRP